MQNPKIKAEDFEEFVQYTNERFELICNELAELRESKTKNKRGAKPKKTTFENSPVARFEDFQLILKSKGWPENEILEYFESASGYSKANGAQYLDWIQAVENWRRKSNKTQIQTFNKSKANGPIFQQNKDSRNELGDVAEYILANRTKRAGA